jgi:hypothetical protein
MDATLVAKVLYKLAIFSLATVSLLGASDALAQQLDEVQEPSLWAKTSTHVVDVAEQGRWDLYLSGYAYHLRRSYNGDSLRKLNEKAWGGGFGKTLRNAHGNDESLYFIGLRDSRRHAQWMAGYAYQWVHGFGSRQGLEAGVGVTAVLVRRQGMFGGAPFPSLLPVASIGTKNVKLMATFIPHVAIRNNKGNVVLLFARFEFK